MANKPIDGPPVLTLRANELGERLLPELAPYHEQYSPLFKRREQREQSLKYLEGLLSNIPNKSVESMVLHREGDNPNAIRAGQQFLSQGAWFDDEILAQHWQEVAEDLGDADGVIILDGSDFPKQGKASVGVKRQWCGQLGKLVFFWAMQVNMARPCTIDVSICPKNGWLMKRMPNDDARVVCRPTCRFRPNPS